MTTNRETIDEWTRSSDVVPARHPGEEPPRDVELVREDAVTDDHERLDWDAFFEIVEDTEMVVVRHEDEDLEVMPRRDALARSTVERTELEGAIEEDEVITSSFTETAVVERTVVEEATVESHVMDRTPIDETYVDAELVSREVEGCEVTDAGGERHEAVDFDEFEPGAAVTDEIDVEVTVDEVWSVTSEVLERLDVESQIVDVDHSEIDQLESDEIEQTVDPVGVQRKILASDLIEADVEVEQAVESEAIHTEWGEGDVFETQLLQQTTVDAELDVRKRFEGTITDGETVAAETISTETLESDVVDEDVHGVEPTDSELITAGTAGTGAVAGEGDAESTEVADRTAEEGAEPTGTADRTDEETHAGAVTLSDSDEGKSVVDTTGEEIGMAAEVEGDTLWVDPHPSLTDRIKATLDWGGHDEDTYPVDVGQIDHIDGSEIALAVQEESERTDT